MRCSSSLAVYYTEDGLSILIVLPLIRGFIKNFKEPGHLGELWGGGLTPQGKKRVILVLNLHFHPYWQG